MAQFFNQVLKQKEQGTVYLSNIKSIRAVIAKNSSTVFNNPT
jgi:hypothetical protein